MFSVVAVVTTVVVVVLNVSGAVTTRSFTSSYSIWSALVATVVADLLHNSFHFPVYVAAVVTTSQLSPKALSLHDIPFGAPLLPLSLLIFFTIHFTFLCMLLPKLSPLGLSLHGLLLG